MRQIKMQLLNDGKQGLHKGKNQEDSGSNDWNECHCKMEIVKLFDTSVIVKLIEEFRSIINLQSMSMSSVVLFRLSNSVA